MKTIVVANQKGGVGKTTLARHLAFFGAEKGLRVLAVDMDVQGNFSTTFKTIAEDFKGQTVPEDQRLVASALFSETSRGVPVPCAENLWYVEADAGIVDVERQELGEVVEAGQACFAKLGNDFDVCVLDTGPAVSNLLIAALSVGDFAVSPCKPDRDAIAGLAGFFSNVVRVRDETGVNPRLAPLGILPNQVNKKRAYHLAVLEQIRSAWGELVLPVELYERAATDVAKDRAVWRTNRGEGQGLAGQEMKAACAYIYKRMGL